MSDPLPGDGTRLSPAQIGALPARWSSCWTIRPPYSEIIDHTVEGVPYLAPELVLLFKAKHARPKDQADFDATVPLLTPARRAKLAALLVHAQPGHRWIATL